MPAFAAPSIGPVSGGRGTKGWKQRRPSPRLLIRLKPPFERAIPDRFAQGHPVSAHGENRRAPSATRADSLFRGFENKNRVEVRLLQSGQITRVQTVGWLGLRVDVVLDTLQTLVWKRGNFGIDFPVASFLHMTEYPCPVSTIPE